MNPAQAAVLPNIETANLKCCLARCKTWSNGNYGITLTLCTPSCIDENGYQPAESIEVNTKEDLILLQELISKALAFHDSLQEKKP